MHFIYFQGNIIFWGDSDSESIQLTYDRSHLPQAADEDLLFMKYAYDGLGQIIRQTDEMEDSTVMTKYEYDAAGRLSRVFTNGTLRATYEYDANGNRKEASANEVTNLYAANELNQYTEMEDESLIQMEYDADGNITNDGRYAYIWDAENRLIEAIPLVTNSEARLVQFMYDFQGRRIGRRSMFFGYMQDQNWRWYYGAYYVFDGWNVIGEYEPRVVRKTPYSYVSPIDMANLGIGQENQKTISLWVWGLDLSGTLQGAGGVGGLLAEITPNGVCYPFCDGNGNITDWIDGDGEIIAHYEYDPFGNEMIGESPATFGFSSKPYDSDLGLYYYGYRFYSPAMGRWINRDPLEEEGGENLYGYTGNDPLNQIDILGMEWKKLLPTQYHYLAGGDHPYEHYQKYVSLYFSLLKSPFDGIYAREVLERLGVEEYTYPKGIAPDNTAGIWNGAYYLSMDMDCEKSLCRIGIQFRIKPYKAPYPAKADLNYELFEWIYFENTCPCNILR